MTNRCEVVHYATAGLNMQKKPSTKKKYSVIGIRNTGTSLVQIRNDIQKDGISPLLRSKKNLSQIGNAYFNTIKGREVVMGIARPNDAFSLKHSVLWDGRTRMEFKTDMLSAGAFRHLRS